MPRPDFEQVIENVAKLGIEVDRPEPEFDGWHFGERVRVLEDHPEDAYREGELGILTIERVGDPAYNNERIVLFFNPDGCDSGEEVSTDMIASAEGDHFTEPDYTPR